MSLPGQDAGLTPMFAQYREFKQQYPDALLLFRLGDFYELFFEDAEVAARELDLVLTGRDGGKALGRVPMCGVPYHSADAYIARLIERGHKVAICEQMEDPRQAKGLVRREVIRVVTPGTLVEPRSLEEKESHFLAAVCQGRTGFGLAYADLSTGEFAACELSGAHGLRQLVEELGRIEPREVLLEPGLERAPGITAPLERMGAALTPYGSGAFRHEAAYRLLCRHFGTHSLRGFGAEDKELAVRAAGAVLQYLEETQKTTLGHITALNVYYPGSYLVLDPATRRNLELTRALRDGGRRGTLLEVLDRTVTAMGGRLLRAWLEQPLLDLAAIRARHEAVGELVQAPLLRGELRSLLGDMRDVERLAGRVAYGSAGPRDLVALGRSLAVLPSLRVLLEEAGSPRLVELRERLDLLDDVRDLLGRAIADDPPVSPTEGGVIRDGFDEEVDRLRAAARDGKSWIAALEARERERTGIKSLKVGYNKVFGYYIEVTRANLAAVPDDYQRRQTLAGAERFVTPDLKAMEEQVLGAEERLAAREYELFAEVRRQVAAQVGRIQASARAVAEIDVLAALAEVAAVYGYTRPVVDHGEVIEIQGGRHPVLERVLPEGRFVPNDCLLDTGENRLLLITGPNMGGKSTYMRQVALITLMAQMGSFVPAQAARIGLVDRIFTRVGASDDLATGQSTFMVEMSEVAAILHAATRRSLIVLDEIGRGTATFDGLSIAWAVAEYVADPTRIGARTLFATHYHELCELEGLLPGVKNYSVAVREKGDEITFLYQIVRGGADRSYGIQVARLAGLPRAVVDRAREILATLEQQEGQRRARREAAAARARQPVQLSFFESRPHPVVEELLALNVMALTPLEALNLLHSLQEKAKEGR
ncbi:DNA mismatch repair protein MutS [Caldinitratiruptor microaerophilus]|uniref:DNA mismatch repair protein MutS n=1 Tax=Caldinitratiruptor microaerophilus TaxID=671077 RepID=A0AA35CIT7_9FIRM|nr:DNA mismatch repair protein MutS [Caldinitratiruptor microaerophilus]BDG60000.1 DNA mismatch repair protein MutS [Caldinitratiruptor microaerophilus]